MLKQRRERAEKLRRAKELRQETLLKNPGYANLEKELETVCTKIAKQANQLELTFLRHIHTRTARHLLRKVQTNYRRRFCGHVPMNKHLLAGHIDQLKTLHADLQQLAQLDHKKGAKDDVATRKRKRQMRIYKQRRSVEAKKSTI